VKADFLEREFAPRRVPSSGGSLLLRPADAIALVQRAADEGVSILGLDGMHVTEKETSSPLEHLVDFSQGVAAGHGCWAEAEAFIRARQHTGLVFEVTLGPDPLEAV
jgi:hypothetical protein